MRTGELKEQLLRKPIKPLVQAKDCVSTGSTLVNLACTGYTSGGIPKGCYVFWVGDSASGKTWYAKSILAEAARSKQFDNHRLVYDGPERGAMMDVAAYFGQALADREEEVQSTLLEEFYERVDEYLDDGRPFIYVLDSMDALDTKEDLDKKEETRKARKSGKKVTGSYGVSRPRMNSTHIRPLANRLAKSESILVIIGQTRHNIGFDAMFNPKTVSGGDALLFYAHLQIWTSIRQRLKKRAMGKDRPVGIVSKIRVKKNRVSGRDRTVLVPIYNDLGIDDTGSLVQFLMDEGHWKKGGKKGIYAEEFDLHGTPDDLARKIEEAGGERKLKRIVRDVWNAIEQESMVQRKPRYV